MRYFAPALLENFRPPSGTLPLPSDTKFSVSLTGLWHPAVHSFNKRLLSTHHEPDPVLVLGVQLGIAATHLPEERTCWEAPLLAVHVRTQESPEPGLPASSSH